MKIKIKYRPQAHHLMTSTDMEQYGIKRWDLLMNHWESWIEVDFKDEKYYTLFMLAHGCHYELYR